ncbi:MAG: hypothetical protein K2X87_30695 [Gemmataceae bacterium]|nr:hypothetical protein [Gemmataceae bacterium]
MTPEPDLGPLAAFTPASGLDPAEVLFRAGRATARTPRVWKLAVAGLVALNVATAAALLLPEPAVVAGPEQVEPAPTPGAHAPGSPEHDSPEGGLLAGASDLDAPRPEVLPNMVAARYPLTALSGRQAEIP